MSETAQLALIAMIATVLVPQIVSSWMAYLKSREAVEASKKNAGAIQDLHIIVNNRLTQLLEATAAAKHAEGVIEGTAATQAATAAAAVTAREVVAAREVVVAAEMSRNTGASP